MGAVILELTKRNKASVPAQKTLKVELFQKRGTASTLLLQAVEEPECGTVLHIELHDRKDLRELLESRREAAKARSLTFEYHNRTGCREFDFPEPAHA